MGGKAPELLRKARSLLLITHKSPDIDGIASAIALALAMKRRGKKCTLAAESASEQITSFASQFGFAIEKPSYDVDCIVVLDTNSPSLFNLAAVKASPAKKILIDHHSPKSDVMAEFDDCIIRENATSTSQIVYRLLRSMREPLTKDEAIAVCSGIYTDSANFIAATPESFAILAEALTKTKSTFQDVLRATAAPIDQSEKIARLKGAQRLELIREGDYLIAVTRVSSFEGSVARSMIGLGADVAFVGAAKEGEARISARARNDLTEKGLHLGRDVLPAVTDLIGGDAGGHAAAAGANGVRPEALESALSVCVSKTREFIQKL